MARQFPDCGVYSKMVLMRDKLITAGLPLVVVLLAVNGIASYRALLRLIENERSVARTHVVLNAFHKLMSTVQDAETGQRGFLLTGEESYLEPYHDALERIRREMAAVESLTQQDPIQLARAAETRKRTEAKLEELEGSIATYRSGGPPAALARVKTDLGQRLMDQIRDSIREMEQQEEEALELRSAESRESGRRALATLTISSVALIGLVTVVAFLISRDLESRRRLQAAMQEHQQQLESRVAERTAELSVALSRLEQEVEERRMAQRKIAEYATELGRSNRELQDFAFVASHDLQEPLRKIRAFADRVIARYSDEVGPDGADYLRRMQNAAERMQHLIRDLLAFSRVSTRKSSAEPVDLRQVLVEVLSDLEVRLQQTGGKVEVGELPTLPADPTMMRQLMQNLVNNALKFHKATEAPLVRIGSRRLEGDAPEYEISVWDNGIGFDEKYRDRIFAPFQQLHARGEYEGTGMGLALCRRIVERHGGSITASSRPGEGSTFVVRLPAMSRQLTPTTSQSDA